ncbi:hypothetical protein [Sphingomonas jeddahensis]|uniref:Uncharacterized protein n=1 Tax=Sphingomonas jeddahensis TaxID=1915074 RepID=A0A1V2EYA4_9SPHN|nr:hypothetical protein [Sphingomonas jeddahensis]ONF97661.1 hypothetical protein SPHI_02930 [Sphingomonas jeddahensis]
MARAVAVELIHLVAGLLVTQVFFRAAIWSYPQGAGSIEPVRWAVMLAVLAMSVPELVKAARKPRN